MARIDKARWKVVSPWLDQLLDADPSTRVARLDLIRRGDFRLAAELSSLLADQTAANRGAFLEGRVLCRDIGVAGATIGAWTLVSILGHGGTSNVWLAHREEGHGDARPVAIKLPSPAWRTQGGADSFQREGTVLARFSHPNIARCLGSGLAAHGQPYLVLEYVNGLPIDRWCAARGLATEARARLLIDVLAAVRHAHERRILHLDLKPANILVGRDGQVKLIDFGIARLLDEPDPPPRASSAFTPGFAAPEQVLQRDVTAATDVYALGVLLYLLLSGRHPTSMPGATPAERLRAVVEDPPPPLPEASRAFDAIVEKALRKSPAARYPTAAALAAALSVSPAIRRSER